MQETQTVTLEDTGFGGAEQDAVEVTLAGGESNESVVLEWTTADGDAGTGDVTVASENDTATEPVTVEEPASFDVAITDTNEPVIQGETLSVTANVTNTGDAQATQTITLEDTGFSGTEQDAVDVTLAGGASNASVTLEWATSSGDAGSGDVTAASENDTDSTLVTVQDPASFAVEIVDTTSPVVEGETLSVTANVTNTGDVQETQTVTLNDTGFGGAEQDAVDVTLAGGASNASVVLEWTTADGDAGTGDVTVASDNDTESRSVTVEEARANFSVSIDNTSAPVVEGDTLSVNATVKNVGDATGARDVNLTDFDGAEVDTQSVSLAAEEKTTVTLNWSTSTGDAGSDNVTVASDNDSASRNVTVNAPAFFAVTIDSANASVTEGEDVVVDYTVENTGGVSDTQDIIFRVNGTQNDTESGVTLNAGGTFSDSFVYPTGDSDVPAITVNVSSDDDGAERTVTVNGVLTAQNDSYTVDEDGSLSVSESNGTLDNDTDPDGDSLSASLDSDVSNGTLTLHDNGSFEYVPDSDFNGEDSFTYKADDGAGGTDTATVTITVNAINDAPTANDLSVTTDEDTAVSGTFDASDPDDSSLSYSIASAPSNGTVSVSGDGFTYTPDSDYAGSDSFTYEVSDDDGATDMATVTITVNAINDAPIAANDSYTVDEDGTLSVSEANGTLANDTDPDSGALSATLASDVSNGSLTLYANGSLTYTPDDGFTGTDSFTYEITDGNGGSDTATVTFNVTATATSQLDQDEYVLESDSGQTITGTSTKAAGSEVTVRIESEDLNNPFVDRQTVSVESDGTFSAEFDVSSLPEGTNLTVQLFNSNGNEIDTATARIAQPASFEVSNLDAPSTAVIGDTVTVTADVTNTGDVEGTTDVEYVFAGDVISELTQSVTLSGGATETVTFEILIIEDIPPGTYEHGVRAGDGSRFAEITILEEQPASFEVSNLDAPSTAGFGDTVTVTADVTNTGDIQGRTVVEYVFAGDVISELTQSVTLFGGATETVTFEVPISEDVPPGTYEHGVQAGDGSQFAEITIEEQPPPTAENDSYTVPEDATLSVSTENGTLANDTDPDGDALSATLVSDVSNGSLTLYANGSFEYVPDPDFNGENSFTYEASDGSGDTDTASVTITVSAVNDAPEITSGPANATIDEENATVLSVAANDADGDALSYDWNLSGIGSLNATSGASVRYDAPDELASEDTATITVTVNDSTTEITATATITVRPVNDAPEITSPPMNATVDEENSTVLSVTATDNDTTDTLSYNWTLTGNGSLNTTTSTSIRYDAPEELTSNGTATVTVSVNDSEANATATATITIVAVNGAPTAANDSYTVDEDGTLSVSAANGTLANDTDPEGGSLSASVVSWPSNGSLTLFANGSFEYTPDTDFNGQDSFTYEASDGSGGTDTASVTITVSAVNDAPEITSGPANATLDEENSTVLSVTATDNDTTDTLSYNWTLTGNGSLNTTTSTTEVTATATVTVNPVNDAPKITSSPASATVDEENSTVLSVTATDNDTTDTLSYNWTLTGNGSLNASSGTAVRYDAPDELASQEDVTLTVTVNDSITEVTATATVTVNPVNNAPEITSAPANATVDEGNETVLSVEATDNDGDALSYNWTLTGNGGLNDTSGTAVRYDAPDELASRENVAVTVTVDDGTANVSANATVTVNPVNDAPEITSGPANATVDKGNTTVLSVTAADNDTTDTLSYTWTLTGNGSLNATSGTSVRYDAPDELAANRTATVRVNVSDGTTNATATATITIVAVNDAPTTANDSYSVDEDATLSVSAENGTLANDTDPDGDILNASVVRGPSNGSLTLFTNGSFKYVPDRDFNGEDSFTYEASDRAGGTDTAMVTITVSAVNDAPEITSAPANATVEEKNSTVLSVEATDADGDTLSYTWTLAGNGSLNATSGTSIRYDAPEELAANETATVTVSVNDSTASATATVTITVVAVNDALTAANDSYTVPEDGTLSVSAANGTLANDTDPDGDVLNASVVSGPSNGSLTLYANGSFEYTPAPDFNGEDSFTYQASDGAGGTDTATVTINVSGVNDPPEITSEPADATVDEGNATVLSVDATDADGDVLSYAWNLSGTGSLNETSGTAVRYDAPNDIDATTDVTVTVTVDDGKETDSATAIVTVEPVNEPPTAENDSYSVDEGTTLAVSAANGTLANDADPDGDSLSASVVSGPSNGTLTLHANGSFAYAPDSGFTGTDSFTYEASDGNGDSDTATVTITVTGSQPTPANFTVVITDTNAPVVEGETLTVTANITNTGDVKATQTVTLTDSGFDGIERDGIDVTLAGGESNASVVLEWTTTEGDAGTGDLTVATQNDSTTEAVTIEPADTNAPPTATDDSYTATEGETLTVSVPGVLDNDTDPDGDDLTVSTPAETDTENGTLTLNADGSFEYTPDDGFTGTDSFTYEVTDGSGGSDTATVTINVTATATPQFAVSITNTNAPVTEGDTLTTSVTVNNVGGAAGTQTITLEAFDSSQVDSQSVSLNPDETATITLEWATQVGDAGSGDLTVASENDTATRSATVNAADTNDPPVASDDSYTTPENETLAVSVPGVLENDTDPDGDSLTVTVLNAPSNGGLDLRADGSFEYTPDAGFTGLSTLWTLNRRSGNVGDDHRRRRRERRSHRRKHGRAIRGVHGHAQYR
ncbi:hypothetical protein BRD19_03625 [Halobacteriales archaeon SW_7_65_23]|nr:MAG: hypothetical protein BRD19_03625 [Halobacteriales archaeon SW_7_65_23]